MPRRGAPSRKKREGDPKYNNRLIAEMISRIMERGKKSLAEKIVYDALTIVETRTNEDGLTVFKRGIDNVRPFLEVRPKRVGGATYQVPVEVNAKRGTTLALRWMIAFAEGRSGKPMSERLAAEILDAAQGIGAGMKKKEDLHKMAEANRAFSHYRF